MSSKWARTRKATIKRRKNMVCKTYQLKVDKSRAPKSLYKVFVEAKWLYNDILASDDIYNYDTKTNSVAVLTPDGPETRDLTVICAQMKQSIHRRIIESTKALSELKKKGYKVGPLKFKSYVNSVPLAQVGNTFDVFKNTIQITKVGRVRARGLKQVPEEAEVASAMLCSSGDDVFIYLSVYEKPEPVEKSGVIAYDQGIKTQLTFSNGVKISYNVPVDQLKKHHRKLSRCKKHSKNWRKANSKLQKAYRHHNNQKKDIKNKVVNQLKKFETVATQNDPLRAWQHIWGRRFVTSPIGEITRELKNHGLKEVPRGEPTTQTCHGCKNLTPIDLKTRIYKCQHCGKSFDRDVNASINILQYVLREPEDLKLDESMTATMCGYFNSIPHCKSWTVTQEARFKPLAVHNTTRVS